MYVRHPSYRIREVVISSVAFYPQLVCPMAHYTRGLWQACRGPTCLAVVRNTQSESLELSDEPSQPGTDIDRYRRIVGQRAIGQTVIGIESRIGSRIGRGGFKNRGMCDCLGARSTSIGITI